MVKSVIVRTFKTQKHLWFVSLVVSNLPTLPLYEAPCRLFTKKHFKLTRRRCVCILHFGVKGKNSK